MISVADYAKRTTKQGEDFYVLILQGGVEVVKSQNTGKMYFTAKKCSVPTTFDETTCQSVIGCQFPGTIKKVACEPYEYQLEDGKRITLEHTWQYVDNTEEMVKEHVVEEAEVI
ncbi:hypothetical protein [Flavivirga jejuensis]|uniref:Uncharacterized protein n=1 Tax=Flavivirga jejuensis TaxID=870487 RepID=A0ABT8WHV2_9FLAO|nr:hypothetical protein [Flavivirga jejuensis]MDO5972700.1 hypothetical protein [Flavivirga jejuensis]